MIEPINILHIFGRMQRGGAELRTLELMRHIDRRRYRLHFCALSGLPGVLDDQIRALGGAVHLVPLGLDFPRRFRSLLRQYRFNVVHSHVHYTSGFMLRLAAQQGVPVRIAHFRSSHDGRGDDLRRRMQRRLMRYWINRYATHILAVCRSAMSAAWSMQWISDPRCSVIYNGLDVLPYASTAQASSPRSEFKLPQACRLYIHVGRMARPKNHQRLLAIFAAIAQQDKHARLLLVGRADNEIERCLRMRAAQLGIADKVIYAGERADVPRLLMAADLLVFPSLWEGLPGVVLEASAAGIPVLASELPVVKEIAPHLPLIRFLPLELSDQAWAKAAVALCEQGRSLQVRQAAAQAFAGSIFTLDRSASEYCRVWRNEARTREAR